MALLVAHDHVQEDFLRGRLDRRLLGETGCPEQQSSQNASHGYDYDAGTSLRAGFSCTFAYDAANELRLFRLIGMAIIAEHFVEPDGGLAIDIWLGPGIPGQIRLRLALHQAPVDHGDAMDAADRKTSVKEAAVAAGHVLGADQRAAKALELHDPNFEGRGRFI